MLNTSIEESVTLSLLVPIDTMAVDAPLSFKVCIKVKESCEIKVEFSCRNKIKSFEDIL